MELKETFIEQHKALSKCLHIETCINNAIDNELFGQAEIYQQALNHCKSEYITISHRLREELYKEFLPEVTPIF